MRGRWKQCLRALSRTEVDNESGKNYGVGSQDENAVVQRPMQVQRRTREEGF